MSLAVDLRGYPEAVLAADRVTLNLLPTVTAGDVVRSLAGRSPRLGEALLDGYGAPRQSTKVIADGRPAHPSVPVGRANSITVLAALPCDG